MKTRCTYTHYDNSVYGGLWPHEYLAIVALMEYNNPRQLDDLIYRESSHPLGIKSDGMRAFIVDSRSGYVKRKNGARKSTACRDLEIYLFIHDFLDVLDTRPLRTSRVIDGSIEANDSRNKGLATLAAEAFGIEEDAAVKAYQRIKRVMQS